MAAWSFSSQTGHVLWFGETWDVHLAHCLFPLFLSLALLLCVGSVGEGGCSVSSWLGSGVKISSKERSRALECLFVGDVVYISESGGVSGVPCPTEVSPWLFSEWLSDELEGDNSISEFGDNSISEFGEVGEDCNWLGMSTVVSVHRSIAWEPQCISIRLSEPIPRSTQISSSLLPSLELCATSFTRNFACVPLRFGLHLCIIVPTLLL